MNGKLAKLVLIPTKIMIFWRKLKKKQFFITKKNTLIFFQIEIIPIFPRWREGRLISPANYSECVPENDNPASRHLGIFEKIIFSHQSPYYLKCEKRLIMYFLTNHSLFIYVRNIIINYLSIYVNIIYLFKHLSLYKNQKLHTYHFIIIITGSIPWVELNSKLHKYASTNM